ncbi:MAG: hypothetical protein PHQ89_00205 [Bacilli bacterium]|nr:hypothetical protein [Bacilli bacterium]
MKMELGKLSEIKDIDSKIDNSFNGTCFAYSWFLKLKKVNKIIKFVDDANEIRGFMPLFLDKSGEQVCQSTMYIPYGGPVIFKIPTEERKKINYIRKIEKGLAIYLKTYYKNINFSTDSNLIDIMPFIREGFAPELRYTYKIDLQKNIEEIYSGFGTDRKREIKKYLKNNIEFYLDNDLKYFSCEKCVNWEKKYNFPSSIKFVKKYIKETISHNRGMCFIAKNNDKIYGGVYISWDSNVAYILYSYFDNNYEPGTISFLYYKIFEYLKEQKIKYVDFEGSVYESVENFNISCGAYQSLYFNIHYSKNNQEEMLKNMYIYYEK